MLVHSFIMSHFVHSIKLKSLTPLKACCRTGPVACLNQGTFLSNVTLKLPPPPNLHSHSHSQHLVDDRPTIPTQECIQTLNSTQGEQRAACRSRYKNITLINSKVVADEWRHTSLMRKILITNIERLHRSENEARVSPSGGRHLFRHSGAH